MFAALPDDEFLDRIAPIDPATASDPLYDDPSGVDLDADIGAPHVRAFAYDGEGNQIETIDRNGRGVGKPKNGTSPLALTVLKFWSLCLR